MNGYRFDALTRNYASAATRRTALQLLTAGLLGGLLAQRGARSALAAQPQRPDRDGDGLYDDDETDVYGTNPDVVDTDGDGAGDGEEVYVGTDPLVPNDDVGPAPLACAQTGQSCAAADCCLGYCTQDAVCACVSDGFACAGIGTGGCCSGQPCNAAGYCGTCSSIGARCTADAECCQGSYAALCCFNGTSLTTVCTDVTNIGFVCPGDAPAPGGCATGQTDCGGACIDLNSHAGHCGACFNSCALGLVCEGGVCVAPFSCPAGQTDCGGYCADLQSDYANCGACHTFCDSGTCRGGGCAPVCMGPGTLCLDPADCCSGTCIGFCT
jgi:hypothetical protein